MKPSGPFFLHSQKLKICKGPFGYQPLHRLAGDHLEPTQGTLLVPGPLVENQRSKWHRPTVKTLTHALVRLQLEGAKSPFYNAFRISSHFEVVRELTNHCCAAERG